MIHKTRRLYYDDPYLLDFKARILKEPLFRKKPAVILDRTCFYPESGGQPADRGWINGLKVVDVVDGDEIVHVLEKPLHAEKAEGRVDKKVRLDHMQQHAGQHILSQSFLMILDAGTVAFHLGATVSTLEMDIKNISEEDVVRVEKKANEVITENREIKTYFVEEKDRHSVPFRRPPQKQGRIRVVEIEGFDFTACGGTHPRRTGEVGLVKILKWERIRGHIRFEFVAGARACDDYILKHGHLRQLGKKLTVKEDEVVHVLEKMQSELKAERQEARKLRETLSEYEAERLVQEEKGPLLRRAFQGRPADDLRRLVSSVIKKGEFCALFGSVDKGRVHMVFGRSDALDVDLRQLVAHVSPLIEGKGGGQPSFVQMTGTRGENIEKALETAASFLQDILGGRS